MKNMKRILLSAMALIAAVALQAQVIETDVTSSVTNPDFENGTTGWTNNGMQTQSNAEFKMKGNTNYCERWVAGPNKLPDSSISQTISVENGTYCITAVAGAIQQGDGSIAIEGVNVIANDQSVAITQAPGIGQFCRLVTEVKNGSLTIAFEVKSTTANWVAFDDVHVYYYGTATIDEAKAFILQKDMYALVEEADEYLGEPMQKAVKDAFLANASKIDSATDLAAAQALLDEMTAQLAEIKACVDVYGRILALIDAAKGDYADWKTDADKLQAAIQNAEKQMNDAVLGSEAAEAAYATFKDIYDAFLIANMDADNDGIDYTDKIVNASIRTNSSGWTINSAAASKTNNFNTYEFWNGSAYTCEASQVITGLPNGLYKVGVTGFYRAGANDGGAAYSDGTEQLTACVFANRKSAPLHSLYEHTTDEFSAKGNLNGYIDNMENAALAFDAGLYGPYDADGNNDGHNLVEVVVTDGTLELGIRNENAPGVAWHIFRDFTLTYFGNFPGVILAGLIEQIMQYMDENVDVLPLGLYYELNDATIEYDATSLTDEAAVTEAYNALSEIFENVKKAVADMAVLTDYLNQIEELAERDYPGLPDLLKIYDEVSTVALDLTNEDITAAQLSSYVAKVQEAILAYYESQEATHENPADYTFMINNPGVRTNTTGWTVTASGLATNFNISEYFNVDYDFNQTLQVANGKYRVGVTGYYREQGNDGGAAYNAGTENITAKLYANTSSTPLLSLYTHTSDESPSATGNLNGYPDNMENAQYAFDDGLYQGKEGVDVGNFVDVVVYDGTLTFGIRNTGHATNSWTAFRDFTLYYYGPATDEDMAEVWTAAAAAADKMLAGLLPGDAKTLVPVYDEAKAMAAEGKYLEACALLNPAVTALDAAYSATATFRKGNLQALLDLKETGSEAVQGVVAKVEGFVNDRLAADDATTAILPAIDEPLGAYVALLNYYAEVEALLANGADYAQNYVDLVNTLMAAQVSELTQFLRSAGIVNGFREKLQEAVSVMQLSAVVFKLKPGDVTGDLVTNPKIDDGNATGWTIEKGTGNGPTITGQHYDGTAENRYLDSWNGSNGVLNFSAYQVIKGLPNGTYELSCAARTDGNNAFIFAATDSIKAASTIFEPIPNYAATGGTFWEADSLLWEQTGEMTAIFNANNGEGWGWSNVKVANIKVTNHLLIFGGTVNSEYTGQPFGGTWFSMDDWKLVLVEKNGESVWDLGIHDAALKETTVVRTDIYATDGSRLTEPKPGINIVRRTLSDGTILVEKILVK